MAGSPPIEGSGRPFPHKAAMTPAGEGSSSVIVTAAAAVDNVAKALYFSTEQLLTALLLFCNKKKIPLPVRGSKHILILNRRLMLVIKVTPEDPAVTGRNLAQESISPRRQAGANWEVHRWQRG
jgi:hypothetical protein